VATLTLNYGAANVGLWSLIIDPPSFDVFFDLSPTPIPLDQLPFPGQTPLPGALVLFGSGLLGLIALGRRRATPIEA